MERVDFNKKGMVVVRALVCAAMLVWMRGYYAIESDVMFDSFVITDEWVLGPPDLGWTMYLVVETLFAIPVMLFAWRYADTFGAKSAAWTTIATAFVVAQMALPYVSIAVIAAVMGIISFVLAFLTVSERIGELFDLWEKGFIVGIVAWVSWRYGAICGAVSLAMLLIMCCVWFNVGMLCGLIKDRRRDRLERG